jgi:anion-transporting  ArsA/GET3 family ATPase
MTTGATPLLDRRLVFVTGKGGTGKTSVATGLAVLAARHGRRVLLCEAEATQAFPAFLDTEPTRFAEREVSPGLWAMSMDTEASLKEYLRLQLRIPLLARLGPLARTFDFMASAAPGVKEILVVGKLCWEVRAAHYDLVVVDAPASGHVVGQLTAPEAIRELVKVGPVREQTAWMLDILADPARTGVVVVTTPEEMPVNETVELAARLRDETVVDLAAVVVNRLLPELFSRGEEEVFQHLRQPAAVAALSDAAGGPVQPVLDGADLAVRLRRSRAAQLAALRRHLSDVELLYVPEMFDRTVGMTATVHMADALEAELGL